MYRAIIVIKALYLIARTGEVIIPSGEYDNNRNRALKNEYLDIAWYDFSNALEMQGRTR